MKFLKYFASSSVKCERACRKSGSSDDLERILQRNPTMPLNDLLYDNNDKALIHLATLSRFCKCVEVLLDHGANPGVRIVSTGNTCLHVASWMGNLDITKVLCSHPDVQVDEMSQGGFTALALACWAGHLDVCKYLLSIGASPRVPNRHGYTPLLLASRCGAVDVVEHLLVSGASDVSDIDHDGCTALHHACFEGRKNLIRLLVKQGVVKDIKDRKGRTAKDLCKTREIADLLTSVQSNNAATRQRTTFQLRLRDRFNLSDTGDSGRKNLSADASQSLAAELSQQYLTTLPKFSTEKTTELSQSHVFSSPKFDTDNQATGSNCSDSDDEENVSYDGVGMFISPKLALECWRLCSSSGDYRAFKRLLTAHSALTECKPSALSYLRDVAGWSLLMRASDKGFFDIVKILLSIDPETVNVTCPHGRTALHLSSANNHEEVTRILLSASASQKNVEDGFINVDHVTDSGRTALHAAAEFGHVNIARLLVYRGANENAPDNEGFTPLHLACQHSNNEMVIFLVTECSSDPLTLTMGGEISEDLTNSLRVKALLRAVISHRKKSSTDHVEYSHGSAQAWSVVESAIAALRSTTPAKPASVKVLPTSPPESVGHTANADTAGNFGQASAAKSLDFKRAAWDLISLKSKRPSTVEIAVAGFSQKSISMNVKSIVSSTVPHSEFDKDSDVYSGDKNTPQRIKVTRGENNMPQSANAILPLRARLKQKYRLAADFSSPQNDSNADMNRSVVGSLDDGIDVDCEGNSIENENRLGIDTLPVMQTFRNAKRLEEDVCNTPPAILNTHFEEMGMRSVGKELKGSLLLTLILSQVYNVYSNKISRAFYRWKYRNQGQNVTKSPRSVSS